MDTRIQFRVSEETKRLAQQMIESQGRTLSDACRNLTEQLADQQRKITSHNIWLTDQVNSAFDKYDAGEANFIEQQHAKANMIQRKAKIRAKA